MPEDNDKNKNPNANDGDNSKDDKNKNGAGDNNNGGDGNGDEPKIPKSRLDEETRKRREAEQKLEKIESDRKKQEEEQLKKKGEFETLAQQKEAELNDYKAKQVTKDKRNALKLEAIKAGTVDADAVVALANLDEVEVDEEGEVVTASAVKIIESMKESKKYLFGNGGNTNIGNPGGAPNGGDQKQTYRRSQLKNGTFYAEHEADILKAMREGRIIDDINPSK